MKKLCVSIIETRPIPNLTQIIKDHQRFLPEHDLFICCQDKNLRTEFPKATFLHYEGEINLRRYNEIYTSVSFWENFVNYERHLTIQSDSMILRPGIEEFWYWDYIGAPWDWQLYGANGGCSLRDPKVMYRICHHNKWDATMGNEDVFFSNILYKDSKWGKLAPRSICMKWGTEAIFTLGTLSYHAIDKYLTPEQCLQIKTQYDENNTL